MKNSQQIIQFFQRLKLADPCILITYDNIIISAS